MKYLLILLISISYVSANDFTDKVKPFLKKYCVDCHGPDKVKGKIRVDGLTEKIANHKETELWSRIKESLEFNEMPSDKAKHFPTKVESRFIEKWITKKLNVKGVQLADRSREPGKGNLVPHDLLFASTEMKRNVDVAARLWRISPESLKMLLADSGLRKGLPTNPFTLDQSHFSFQDVKGRYQLNSMMTDRLTELAMEAALNNAKNSAKTIEYAIKKGQTEVEAVKYYVKSFYQRITRRDPDEKLLTSLMGLVANVDSEVGAPRGIQAALAIIILQPESIFRVETVHDKKGEIVELSKRQLVYNLAFALTDRAPSAMLMRDVKKMNLPAKELMETLAKELIAKDRYAPGRLLEFFKQYFEYEKGLDIFKDNRQGLRHEPKTLVKSLDKLVVEIIEKDEQVFKTLLTTRDWYLMMEHHGDYSGPTVFNLSPDWKARDITFKVPDHQRMGILTHPAWLVAHSGNFDNDPIRRGLWIRQKLLGGNVPDVPITVDAKLPDEPKWTLRKRLHVTEADECYKCHSMMNPLGLAFEQFDHYGRFRTEELGKPVDTSAAITKSGDPALDGKIGNAIEMIDKLSKSKKVEQVFVRHVFRFFMGRNETLGDAKTLQEAHKAYVDSNGSFKALVTSILSSDSFIYRTKVQPKETTVAAEH